VPPLQDLLAALSVPGNYVSTPLWRTLLWLDAVQPLIGVCLVALAAALQQFEPCDLGANLICAQ
jgi:hypothetical protein